MARKRTDLVKTHELRDTHMDPCQYTLTLLQEANHAGLVDESSLSLIQTEIMSLLAEMILKYNHGASTSVRAETAEQILNSILYAIDAQLLSFSEHEDALNSLKTENVKKIYAQGLELITLCVSETKKLYGMVAGSKLKVDLYAYNSTIDEALPEFFTLYDPVYNAQDTWASIDYPLLYDDLTGSGIYYIKQYLECLEIENCICSLFNPRAVLKLLNNYGKVYRIDYKETLINIMEVVLTNSIFSVLSGNSALELSITKQQYTVLQEKLQDLDNDLCLSLISGAIDIILGQIHIDEQRVRDYIFKYQSILMPRFISALENNSLMNIIIIDRDENQPLDILWDEGNRLNDDDFRLMVAQILECPSASEKAAIINSNIHSLGDFLDVLEADCLFAAEYATLYASLGDMELSILARIVFAEELRVGGVDNLRQFVDDKQLQMPWQMEYANFFIRLRPERIKSIQYLIPASLQTNKPSIY